MAELKGIEYMRAYLNAKRARVLKRYEYYEMKDKAYDRSALIPHEMQRTYRTTMGWCAKAVDALADRLVFDEFENDVFDMNGIYALNNPDILFDSAVLSALISSCCFIAINERLEMEVIDGSNATGCIDARTGLLTEGYAVLERDDLGNVIRDAYFTPGRVDYYAYNSSTLAMDLITGDSFVYELPYVLLVPVIYRPDAKRPFGHSRISRACMRLQEQAKNTMLRKEVTAEFYSFPQKWVVGLSSDSEAMDKYKATISSFLQFDKDEDGDRPVLGQFQTASMTPHLDDLRSIASLFAGETDLTLDDLGFNTSNPSSAEAIKASHENLRLRARKAQRTLGSGLKNAGFVAACLRDKRAYDRGEITVTTPTWAPIFEPDAAMLSAIGDGVMKLNQSTDGYIGDNNMRKLTGLKADR